ncbi:MAG TPA: hypothetical protein VG603_02500 [Chitinophagales bacterium]|nr:hypothetical protein [Chitinophagales bacterium]
MNNKSTLKGFALFVAVCGLLGVFSCKKENPGLTLDYKYNYYPLDSGHYIIYDVDSIHYSYNQGFFIRDTIRYQWMAIVTDTFYDNLGELSYKIEHLRRADSSAPWVYDRVWYATRSTTNLVAQEDDIRFIKLVFPPAAGESWNGNAYVATSPSDQYAVYQNWNYFYENTDTTLTLNGETYNNAMVVSEVDNSNAISNVVRSEVYAPNVGMIYQRWDDMATVYPTSNWDTAATSGFRVIMKAWSHYP